MMIPAIMSNKYRSVFLNKYFKAVKENKGIVRAADKIIADGL